MSIYIQPFYTFVIANLYLNINTNLSNYQYWKGPVVQSADQDFCNNEFCALFLLVKQIIK